jgi:hypothetical protein
VPLKDLDLRREFKRQLYHKIKLRALKIITGDKPIECNWPDCKQADLDVLCIDHVNDDGALERESGMYLLYKIIR